MKNKPSWGLVLGGMTVLVIVGIYLDIMSDRWDLKPMTRQVAHVSSLITCYLYGTCIWRYEVYRHIRNSKILEKREKHNGEDKES